MRLNQKLNQEIKQALGSLNPLVVLKAWLKTALTIKGLKDPWAMLLSTSCKGRVSSRVLLLKQLQGQELIFYSNYTSQKAEDMANNPLVAVNFYWPDLNRQIRIQGRVKKTSRAKSLAYWRSRSRGSQLSQFISRQSQAVSCQQKLEALKQEAYKKFDKKAIPCPKLWGGYKILIHSIEFWQEGPHRLHDRFLFKKAGKTWQKQRLFP